MTFPAFHSLDFYEISDTLHLLCLLVAYPDILNLIGINEITQFIPAQSTQ